MRCCNCNKEFDSYDVIEILPTCSNECRDIRRNRIACIRNNVEDMRSDEIAKVIWFIQNDCKEN